MTYAEHPGLLLLAQAFRLPSFTTPASTKATLLPYMSIGHKLFYLSLANGIIELQEGGSEEVARSGQAYNSADSVTATG